MESKHMRTVAALLTFVVVAFGQDCPSSPCAPTAEKAAPDLSSKIAKLETRAAKGCKTSEARLTELCKAAGATDTKDLKAKVAAFEKYAPCGCDMSQKKLAELTAVLAPQPGKANVSARLPILLAVARNGDAQAKAILKQLCDECCPPDCCDDECGKDCGKDCGDQLTVQVQTLEASAAKGCSTSATKLAKAETALSALPATSTRVAKVLASARKGDTKAQAALKSLCAECCPPAECGQGECGGKGECGKGSSKKECGKECGDKLMARIQALETSVAKGCATSVTKLARVEAKLPAATKAEKPADCGGCLPEGCPGGQ
jgi:hypothetical protein